MNATGILGILKKTLGNGKCTSSVPNVYVVVYVCVLRIVVIASQSVMSRVFSSTLKLFSCLSL